MNGERKLAAGTTFRGVVARNAGCVLADVGMTGARPSKSAYLSSMICKMVTSCVLGLASVYVLSLDVDALATTSGSQKNSVQVQRDA